MTARATVLMYHRLSVTPPADRDEAVYTLDPARFRAQLDEIRSRGCRVPGADALFHGTFPNRSVVLTFDDGSDSDLTEALPALADRGLTAVFFLSPELVGRPGYLSWDGARELFGAGMAIGSHGLDHTLLGGLGDRELRRQLEASKGLLEDRLGTRIVLLSLPGGSGGARAARVARSLGYRLVFGSRPGLVAAGPAADVIPRYALRRLDAPRRLAALVDQAPGTLALEALADVAKRAVKWAVGRRLFARVRDGALAVSARPDPQQ